MLSPVQVSLAQAPLSNGSGQPFVRLDNCSWSRTLKQLYIEAVVYLGANICRSEVPRNKKHKGPFCGMQSYLPVEGASAKSSVLLKAGLSSCHVALTYLSSAGY